MEKQTRLELWQIAAYLPYGLKIEILNYKCDYVGIQYAKANGFYELTDELYVTYHGGSTGKSVTDFKPILRPLSDLGTYLPTINTNVDFEIDSDAQIIIDLDDYQRAYVPLESYLHHVNFLLANHFDVFGLIDAGLAVDINTINP